MASSQKFTSELKQSLVAVVKETYGSAAPSRQLPTDPLSIQASSGDRAADEALGTDDAAPKSPRTSSQHAASSRRRRRPLRYASPPPKHMRHAAPQVSIVDRAKGDDLLAPTRRHVPSAVLSKPVDAPTLPLLPPTEMKELEAIERSGMVDEMVARITEEDLDIFRRAQDFSGNDATHNHKVNTRRRKPAIVQLDGFEISTWFSAPYPREYLAQPKVFLCSFCLKCFKTDPTASHTRHCSLRHPPGREVYRKGRISVFELDGGASTVYCQNVCLLGKLFLDCKILFYDVAPLLFYILTLNDLEGCHFVGYFSKEKHSPDQFNVACIATLPPYQKSGYGRFLIDFSYLLSRKELSPGTPERPLTRLGKLSFDSYWRSAVLEWLHGRRGSISQLSIQTMIDETGIFVYDLMNTLRALKMLIGGKRGWTLRFDEDLIEAHWQRAMTDQRRIWIDESALRWTPYSSTLETAPTPPATNAQLDSPAGARLDAPVYVDDGVDAPADLLCAPASDGLDAPASDGLDAPASDGLDAPASDGLDAPA